MAKTSKRGAAMTEQHPLTWRHFQADLILLCVGWYLRYPLRYRHLEEMMVERGLHVDHTTIYRSRPVLCSPTRSTVPTSISEEGKSVRSLTEAHFCLLKPLQGHQRDTFAVFSRFITHESKTFGQIGRDPCKNVKLQVHLLHSKFLLQEMRKGSTRNRKKTASAVG